MRDTFTRARTAFLERCAVWSLPRIGVPERSIRYLPNSRAFEKRTRLDLATSYRRDAAETFERRDLRKYGASWPASNWAQVVAEHKSKGEWTTTDAGDFFTVTRPAVSPRRVLGLFGARDIGNRLLARFGAWVMGRRG